MNYQFIRFAMSAALAMCLVVQGVQTLQAQPQTNSDSRGPDPIVDINKPQPDEAPSEIRTKRNKRHNLPGGRALAEPSGPTVDETVGSDFQESLPALPLAQSDAIVTGTLTKATAHLSEDKAMVYSEFRVAISDVLKTAASVPLRIGQSIDVERLGGAVRFPSGRMWHFRVNQQGFPHAAGTYVLFIKYQAQTDDFYLVTGYELKAGRVAPLDGVGFNSNPKLRLKSSRYDGVDENTFFADLRNAINGGGKR